MGRLLFRAVSIFCPAEIKEILLPARCEAISVISAISVGHFYLMRKVFCPTVIGFAASLVEEIKEIAEIIVTRPREALSAISAISAGHNYLMRIVFFCPAEIKEIKEIFLINLRSSFCYFCHFCGTISTSCG